MDPVDVVVVGGGLSGLTAAALLARAGRRVALFERSKTLGGRGGSRVEKGFAIDLGPHALYVGGPATKVLASLGIRPEGVDPVSVMRQYVQLDGALHPLPNGAGALLRTSALSVGGKLELTRLLTKVLRLETSTLDGVTLKDWLDGTKLSARVRALVDALFRVTNYAHAPDLLSAGAAIRQLRTGFKGVRYLHGGWATLVDSLHRAAIDSGVRVQLQARVTSILGDASAEGVALDDGTEVRADAVLLAGTPDTALQLFPDPALSAKVSKLRRARAATLAVALDTPFRGPPFILGADAPIYLSVQSVVSRLAPEGGALVHVARYLHPDEEVDIAAVERELEALLDLAEPGWRDHVVLRQFLPNLTVTHGLATAELGGERGRPGVVTTRPGLFLCGDWVGDEGALLNAAVGSARQAVTAILERSALRRSA